MNFDLWLQNVPKYITEDSLWKMTAYRLALFAADLAWYDATKLLSDKRTLDCSGQLYRAVGSIEANIAEGYSRSTGRDRARFYDYALGSARESRGWYYKGRHVLGDPVMEHRLDLITNIVRLLLKMVPDQRAGSSFLHEECQEYRTIIEEKVECSQELLQIIPMPPIQTPE